MSHNLKATKENTKFLWKPPSHGWIKCNTDVSLVKDGFWGLRTIFQIQNELGDTIQALSTRREGDDNPLVVETLAMKLAISKAIKCDFQKVNFETDNMELVKMMNEDEDRLPRTTICMMYKAIFIQKH